MIFISPPFGNYLSIRNTISIKGSYTLEPRSGLIIQILNTLRYSFKYYGWINKIGLKNPGIYYALKNYDTKSLISIAILNKDEIPKLLEKIPRNMNLEINVSCPNLEQKMIENNIHKFINNERRWCIIKVSPYCTTKKLDEYYKYGFRQFHCSNTIPTKNGGLSGSSIIPHSTLLVAHLKNRYPNSVVIGGGGIKTKQEIDIYKKCGADYFSISTLCFHPILFYKFYKSVIKPGNF